MRAFARTNCLNSSTTGEAGLLLQARAISEIGILSRILHSITAALLTFTADRGNSEIPAPEAIKQISVGISPATWNTSGITPARLRIPNTKSWVELRPPRPNRRSPGKRKHSAGLNTQPDGGAGSLSRSAPPIDKDAVVNIPIPHQDGHESRRRQREKAYISGQPIRCSWPGRYLEYKRD